MKGITGRPSRSSASTPCTRGSPGLAACGLPIRATASFPASAAGRLITPGRVGQLAAELQYTDFDLAAREPGGLRPRDLPLQFLALWPDWPVNRPVQPRVGHHRPGRHACPGSRGHSPGVRRLRRRHRRAAHPGQGHLAGRNSPTRTPACAGKEGDALAGQLEAALAHLRRLTTDNARLREELEAARVVSHLSTFRAAQVKLTGSAKTTGPGEFPGETGPDYRPTVPAARSRWPRSRPFPMSSAALKALKISWIEIEEAEADDVIVTLVRTAPERRDMVWMPHNQL